MLPPSRALGGFRQVLGFFVYKLSKIRKIMENQNIDQNGSNSENSDQENPAPEIAERNSSSEDDFAERVRGLNFPPFQPVPRHPRPVLHTCPTCHSSYTSRYALARHELHRHAKICDRCNLEFRTVAERERHREFCQRRFGIRRPIRYARRRALTSRPQPQFKCIFCDLTFRTRRERTSHQHECPRRLINR